MNKFGDPTFKKHRAISQVWGVLAVRLANINVLPFEATVYATTLEKYTSKLNTQQKIKLNIKPLVQSIANFKSAAEKLDHLKQNLSWNLEEGNGSALDFSESILEINRKLRGIEVGFICKRGGLPGREWFKNVVSMISALA